LSTSRNDSIGRDFGALASVSEYSGEDGMAMRYYV
jgi:hypothetical protein